MTATIYDKTDKGREEILTRKYQLATRLRTLLVMVDGKQDADALLKKVAGLGLNEQNLQELIDLEFIGPLVDFELSLTSENLDPQNNDRAPEPSPPTSPNSSFGEVPVESMSDAERFQTIYNFFNETIKSTIGLRGYGLQLKVERASNISDFRELRQAYIEAVLKAKGREMARSLRDRLDYLLYNGESVGNDTILRDDL